MASVAQIKPLDTDAVLREEAKAVHGNNARPVEGKSGVALCRALGELKSTALCLSGGGIRSAAFALGVMQALASHPRRPSEPHVGRPEDSILARFHYLSTVSGGGYIGGWLVAWRARAGFDDIWRQLVSRPDGPNHEPHVLEWLRTFSNYLTPHLGILSADTWAGAALTARNLILNWLMILPLVCVVILALKIIAVGSDWITHDTTPWYWQVAFAVAGVACLVKSLAFVTQSRPTRQAQASNQESKETCGPDQAEFLRSCLLWSVLSAILLSQFLASDLVGTSLMEQINGLATRGPTGLFELQFSKLTFMAAGALVGAIIYAAGWVAGRPRNRDFRDFACWTVSGMVYGILVALAVYVYVQVPDDGLWIFDSSVLHLILGVPWMLFAQTAADTIFAGLTSYENQSDADREWFGRAAGWFLAVQVAWLAVTFLAFFSVALTFGDKTSEQLVNLVKTYAPPVAALSGFITALLGKSRLSPANDDGKDELRLIEVVLPIAAMLFAAAMIVGTSIALDELLLGKALIPDRFDEWESAPNGFLARVGTFLGFVGGLCVAVAVAIVASKSININRFSLHALYRNRLIRAFLGASRERAPNAFTGFDTMDNPKMHALWPTAGGEADGRTGWRPFPVINIALNVVSSKRLAWQERKAEPFIVSPLHSGGDCVGFHDSRSYGDADGISLGTAMAISGAAASPNMGYNSSPAITFLMTLFNVRLGWLLANPASKDASLISSDSPVWGIAPLLYEMFGQTTDDRNFVYLSDGGHFENLGLYEMVRRRCRCIVVSDAGCDEGCRLEDLGNAVRKIAIDLGVSITFRKLDALKPRSVKAGADVGLGPYHALGDIDYCSADGGGENGLLLYLKPGYHGTESAGVRAYAIAHPSFPHEGTTDQFFGESQFESYRALGFEILDDLLRRAAVFIKPEDAQSPPAIIAAIGKIEWRAPANT